MRFIWNVIKWGIIFPIKLILFIPLYILFEVDMMENPEYGTYLNTQYGPGNPFDIEE